MNFIKYGIAALCHLLWVIQLIALAGDKWSLYKIEMSIKFSGFVYFGIFTVCHGGVCEWMDEFDSDVLILYRTAQVFVVIGGVLTFIAACIYTKCRDEVKWISPVALLIFISVVFQITAISFMVSQRHRWHHQHLLHVSYGTDMVLFCAQILCAMTHFIILKARFYIVRDLRDEFIEGVAIEMELRPIAQV